MTDGLQRQSVLAKILDCKYDTAQCLHPLTSLFSIMRPNTPHVVFTTQHSIVHGGHFYSTLNLQHTFYGLIHCFMANNLVTNTEHVKTRRLLIRMLQYFHNCLVSGAAQDGEDIFYAISICSIDVKRLV
jgi:hypothetical protein